MALTRNDKEQLLAEYESGLAQAPHAFLLGYQGITVPQVTELRNKVRAAGGEYVVVKNTLALRAIDSSALGQLKEHFNGPTAVVFSQKDPVALAKALDGLRQGRSGPAVQGRPGGGARDSGRADPGHRRAARAATSCSRSSCSCCSRRSPASSGCWPPCRSRS